MTDWMKRLEQPMGGLLTGTGLNPLAQGLFGAAAGILGAPNNRQAAANMFSGFTGGYQGAINQGLESVYNRQRIEEIKAAREAKDQQDKARARLFGGHDPTTGITWNQGRMAGSQADVLETLAQAYPEIYGTELIESRFAVPGPVNPALGKNKIGYATQVYNELAGKENLTQEEANNLYFAKRILTQPQTVVTPRGTEILPAVGLPSGGGGGGAAGGGGVGTGGGGGDTGFVPAKVVGEQTGRAGLAAQVIPSIDRIGEIMKSNEYKSPAGGAFYMDKIPGGHYASPTTRELNLHRGMATELMLRILTGAAAPETEQRRAQNWFDLPPWASDAEIDQRVNFFKGWLTDYLKLVDPGGNLTIEEAIAKASELEPGALPPLPTPSPIAEQPNGTQRQTKTINGKTYYQEGGKWYEE